MCECHSIRVPWVGKLPINQEHGEVAHAWTAHRPKREATLNQPCIVHSHVSICMSVRMCVDVALHVMT